MGLSTEVGDAPRKKWTRQVVDELLGPDDAAELDALLRDPRVVVNHIHHALRKRGIGVSESAVQKWAAEVRRDTP